MYGDRKYWQVNSLLTCLLCIANLLHPAIVIVVVYKIDRPNPPRWRPLSFNDLSPSRRWPNDSLHFTHQQSFGKWTIVSTVLALFFIVALHPNAVGGHRFYTPQGISRSYPLLASRYNPLDGIPGWIVVWTCYDGNITRQHQWCRRREREGLLVVTAPAGIDLSYPLSFFGISDGTSMFAVVGFLIICRSITIVLCYHGLIALPRSPRHHVRSPYNNYISIHQGRFHRFTLHSMEGVEIIGSP